jgi:hypothetical protein
LMGFLVVFAVRRASLANRTPVRHPLRNSIRSRQPERLRVLPTSGPTMLPNHVPNGALSTQRILPDCVGPGATFVARSP